MLPILLALAACSGDRPGRARDAGTIDDRDAGDASADAGEPPLPDRDAGYENCLDRCGDELLCCENAFGTGIRGCTDPAYDLANCGGCGIGCDEGRFCDEGECRCPGDMECDGACVDLMWDPASCGSCGNACGGDTPWCWIFACRDCDGTGGLTCPDGACHRHLEEEDHCGGCDVVCADGSACVRGACIAGDCGDSCPGDAVCCTRPWGADGDGCTSLEWDGANCGACGRGCARGEGCVRGVCVAQACEARCSPGETCCGDAWGGDGECTSVEWDVHNCGACGNECEAGLVCTYGRCMQAS